MTSTSGVMPNAFLALPRNDRSSRCEAAYDEFLLVSHKELTPSIPPMEALSNRWLAIKGPLLAVSGNISADFVSDFPASDIEGIAQTAAALFLL
jgi:hypothetical protein